MESPQQLELVGGRAGAAVLCAKCRAASGLCINYFQICTLYIGEGGRHVLLLWLEYMNTEQGLVTTIRRRVCGSSCDQVHNVGRGGL